MPEEKLSIRLVVNDAEATKRLMGFGQKIKEMGERVSFVGSRFTAMFTVPVMGGLALLGRYGSEAAKQVNELQKELTAAIKAGDVDTVAALNEQMKALPEHVRRSARAWNDLQAALQPANDALNEAKTTLLESIVPLVRELAPLLTDAAVAIKDLVTGFSNLPIGAQKAIIGMVGLGISIGPVMLIVGQFMGMLGSAAQILGFLGIGFGAGGAAGAAGGGFAGAVAWAAKAIGGFGVALGELLLPLGLFVGALLIADRIVKDYIGSWPEAFRRAATAAQQLFVIGNTLIGGRQAGLNTYNAFGMGRAGGGSTLPGHSYMVGERGPERLTQGARGGYVTPLSGGSRGVAGATVNFYYNPGISLASQDEIERAGNVLRDALRRSP
jgi:hypothetical protein